MDLSYKQLCQIGSVIGDSWYILESKKFFNNYRNFLSAFRDLYPLTNIAYSYKTNYIPDICKIVDSNDGFAEVVSEMEYDLAIKLGVKPGKIIVNGPYKPVKAIEKFLLNGSIVNLDSYTEAALLKDIVRQYPENIFRVGVRCNFEFSGLSTSRFGFDVKDNDFYNLINELNEIDNIEFTVLHCHFPNRDVMLFEERVSKMLNLYRQVVKDGKPSIIDIGGGLGGNVDDAIKKQLNYSVGEYKDYAEVIARKFNDEYLNAREKPQLLLEPGTALVADTMRFVCKVVDIKKIRNKYIAISSGSKVNFQPMASRLNIPIKVYGKSHANKMKYDSIDISGYTCMEGDYLFRNYSGELEVDDYIVVENIGSYSVVFKPPFIRPNVPIVVLDDGGIKIIKEAETFDYIFQTYRIEN